MFSQARAAGLPMLGGIDFYVASMGRQVRAHFWAVNRSAQTPRSAGNDSVEDIQNAVSAAAGAATIVICPGFTEFCEKYSAVIERFHKSGHNVLIIDWPGQGMSGHYGWHPLAVHCDDFADYLDSLDAVIDAAGLASRDLILLGHSMGGHLALRYAVRRPGYVLGVILTAPMMAPPVMPVWLIRAISAVLSKMGLRRSYLPFHRNYALDWVRHFRPENPLTRCPKGYESQFIWFDDLPELRRSGPTIGWVRAAYRSAALYTLNPEWLGAVTMPVMALVAGDERVVFGPATDYALAKIPNVERHDFADARHELLHELPEVTTPLWTFMNGFIERITRGYDDELAPGPVPASPPSGP